MASIPDFNYNNVLPPHLGNPTDTSKTNPTMIIMLTVMKNPREGYFLGE